MLTTLIPKYVHNDEKHHFGHMIGIREYIKQVRASGRWSFTMGQAIDYLKISQPVLCSGLL